jgi:hypothetical protein
MSRPSCEHEECRRLRPFSSTLLGRALARQPIPHELPAKTVFSCPRDMPSFLAAPLPLVWPRRDPSDKSTRQITHLQSATPVQISTTIMGTSSGIEPRSRWHGRTCTCVLCVLFPPDDVRDRAVLSLPGFGRLYTEPESEVKSSTCSLLCLVMKVPI